MSARIPDEFRDWPAGTLPVTYGPYRAVVRYIVDGDTLDALVDLGGRTYVYWTLRLLALDADGVMRGIDTPEKNRRETAAAGYEAMRFTRAQVPVGARIVIQTEPDPDSFGRFLATVRMQDGRDLGTVLVAAGHAVYRSYKLAPPQQSAGALTMGGPR